MAQSDRPSGLTAIAVVNFLFAGLLAVGMLAMGVSWAFVEAATSENPAVETVTPAEIAPQMMTILSCMVVEMILLVLTGIAFLGLKRWGWYLGNLYAIFGLVEVYVVLKILPVHLGGGQFGMGNLSSIFYPIFLLILLNLVFRRDLVK